MRTVNFSSNDFINAINTLANSGICGLVVNQLSAECKMDNNVIENVDEVDQTELTNSLIIPRRKKGQKGSSFIHISTSFNSETLRVYHTVTINPVFAPRTDTELATWINNPDLCTTYSMDRTLRKFFKKNDDRILEDYGYINVSVEDFKSYCTDSAKRKSYNILQYFNANCCVEIDGSIELSDAIATTYELGRDFKNIHIIKKDYRRVA